MKKTIRDDPDQLSACTRRDFLTRAGAAGGLTLSGVNGAIGRAQSGAREQRSPARPNIIFLLTDDQRADTLGSMGNPYIRTPHLDRISAEGTLFVNNFCTSAVCQASRASMLTGLYESSHEVIKAADSLSSEAFARSFPALLRQAGYRTAFYGKWHFGGGKPFPKEVLFDEYDGFFGQGRYFQEVGGKRVHLTSLIKEKAIGFLKNREPERPFCLWVSFKAPHPQEGQREGKYFGEFAYDPAYEGLYQNLTIPRPETADPKYFAAMPDFIRESELRLRWEHYFSTPEKFQTAVKGYYRLVTGVDAAVGEIVAELERLGINDQTIIVYTSDNGYFFGEHGLADKSLMHEESIRTPLIIRDPRLPGRLRGRRVEEMALNIDIAPTLLDFAGINPLPAMQGRSLRPLLAGRAGGWRQEWLYQHLFDFDGKIPASEGIRTRRWKYIRYVNRSPLYEELYDLRADPRETRNLAGSRRPSAALEEMRGRWAKWKRSLDLWRPDRPWRPPV